MKILMIGTTDLSDLIRSYSVRKADVVAGSGVSESGVSWDQVARSGKASIAVGLTMTDSEITSFGTLIASSSFSVTYLCRGAEVTGTFKVRASNESLAADDVWHIDLTFEEL